MRLLLFDIDGTLLRCGPQVRPLFAAAFEETFGFAADFSEYDFSGKTDPQIIFELMTAAGASDEDACAGLDLMRENYLRRLDAGLDPEQMEQLPGIDDLMEDLSGPAAAGQITIGLLTGNWSRGAEIKLSRLGLAEYFPFGAFGEDSADRCKLPPIAVERAFDHTGRKFGPDQVVIIGDSIRDVACAKAHDMISIAVTTGFASEATLAAAGADLVMPDLAGRAEELAFGTLTRA